MYARKQRLQLCVLCGSGIYLETLTEERKQKKKYRTNKILSDNDNFKTGFIYFFKFSWTSY